MNLFRRVLGSLSGSLQDPVLGSLAQQDGRWTGQRTWEHSPGPFSLTVYRKGEMPSPADRAAFQALARNYPGLRSGLQEALHQLWDASRSQTGRQAADFGGALDLWARITLQGVGLYPDGHVELIYGFDGPGCPDGAFIVSVRDRQVEPVEYVQ